MVHRVQKVVPDLDDRLISPDSARNSLNMRFAASQNDTNLSMSLVPGMAELEYSEANPLPAGDNKVIGAKEDFESQSVFFALWNSNDDHGIYRIQGNNVDLVIGGSILNFDPDSDVSIAVIDGKIYWTDDRNQPRMCSIAKGIANDYPSPLEEWMITQIKRPPGLILGVTTPNPISGLEGFSVDYGNTGPTPFPLSPVINSVPTQFSYYYIYDNDEESRLGPVSQCEFISASQDGITIRIPLSESNPYLYDINLVSTIVFVWRNGNDGPWKLLKRVKNLTSSYVNISGDFYLQVVIANTDLLSPAVVSSDIVNADFDSVPLLSSSNEVAQNRLCHSDYVLDYDNWDELTISLTKVSATSTVSNFRTFKEDGIYSVGIGLYDEDRRKIGVINSSQIQFNSADYAVQYYNTGSLPPVPPAAFDADLTNTWWLNYSVSGNFPSWCKYWSVEYSKTLNYTYFNRTVCKVYYWYTKGGLDFFAAYGEVAGQYAYTLSGYTFKGYAFELTSGEPFLFNSQEKQVLRVFPQYYTRSGFVPVLPFLQIMYQYPIKKVVNNLILIEEQNQQIYSPTVFKGGQQNDSNDYITMYYQIELSSIPKTRSEVIWQSTSLNKVNEGLTGSVYGDCYLNKFKKTNNGSQVTVLDIISGNVQTPNTITWTTDDQQVTGYGISMNPTNIYAQNWDSDIGTPNTVNDNQRQVRIQQGIIFSDPLIQGTQINGLSKFNSVDNRQAPLENGPITALVRTSATQREPGVLLAIGKNGVSSFYYDGIQLTNVDGTSNVSTSDKYLASQRPLVGNYGAEKLRNICATPLGTVYYWSEGIRDWIRYTNAGLEQLGETYQFMNYLRDQLDSSTSVMMTYDQVTDEAIIVGDDSNAYVFSERFKTFQGGRAYYDATNIRPERGATLSTRTFFFLEGHIWQMGPSVAATTENSFFGTLRNPELTIVSNEMPTVAKQWNSIKVLGNRPLTCQMNSGNSELPSVESHIDQDWWINRKGDWDAAIRRDENSVGGVMNGKIMESRILISTFAWDATNFDKLNYIEVKSNKSIVQ